MHRNSADVAILGRIKAATEIPSAHTTTASSVPETLPDAPPQEPETVPQPAPAEPQPDLDPFEPDWPDGRPEPQPKA